MNSQQVKLERLVVSKLFGRFDYSIDLENEQSLTIITAPNGYGKTVILNVIKRFFNQEFYYFNNLQFKEIQIQFNNGRMIEIHKDTADLFAEETPKSKINLTFKSIGFDDVSNSWQYVAETTPANRRMIERYLPVSRVGPDEWMDHGSEQVLTLEELVARYQDELPDEFLPSANVPVWLKEISTLVECHLIETQRLLALEYENRPRRYREQLKTKTVVEKDAKELAGKIGELLKRYAIESQKLDQSFPKRIISRRKKKVLSEAEVREELSNLNKKHDELVSVGMIGKSIQQEISKIDVLSDSNILKILSIYIEDTKIKLSIFDDLYEKVSLFKQIINDHFSFKSVNIDAEKGITSSDIETNIDIPLGYLSSGEQHELVLLYELLFNVNEGALILVDEPELSLHVAWQKSFILDIQKIQNLKHLRVIIATHSPQIINDKWDLVQDLSKEN